MFMMEISVSHQRSRCADPFLADLYLSISNVHFVMCLFTRFVPATSQRGILNTAYPIGNFCLFDKLAVVVQECRPI